MTDLTFTAIDFETANASRASVCQLGAVRFESGEIVDRAEWLVYPPTGLNFTTTWVHGITAEDVHTSPEWPEIWEAFQQFNKEQPLVSYSPFDPSVMRAANRAVGLPEPDFNYMDALRVARRLLEADSYKLPRIADLLGVHEFEHHDALADAEA